MAKDKIKLEVGKTYATKDSFEPLFRKGDLFRIIKLNDDENLLPIEAQSIKKGYVFGFNEGELEEVKNEIHKKI